MSLYLRFPGTHQQQKQSVFFNLEVFGSYLPVEVAVIIRVEGHCIV
jgi:hypothetical protein